MTYRHILINSLQRSGGSLLARLFDGHPAVLSLPVEMQYSPRKVFWTEPDVFAHRDFDAVAGTLRLQQVFAKLETRGHASKDIDRLPLHFDYDGFIRDIRARLDETETWGLAAVIDAVAAAFSDNLAEFALADGQAPRTVLVNHLSMACFADPDDFFSYFGDGVVVQPVRHPLAWYASMKSHFQVASDDAIYRTYATYLWIESTLRGLVASGMWPERYILVRYEDIVGDTQTEMQRLTAAAGIEMLPQLMTPTLAGRPWRGNSAFAPMDGVDTASVARWHEMLSDGDTHAIAELTGTVMQALGYGRASIDARPALPESLEVPALGIRENLHPVDTLERLRRQDRRMSILTHAVFQETIQRIHGGRYSGRARESGYSSVFRRLGRSLFQGAGERA